MQEFIIAEPENYDLTQSPDGAVIRLTQTDTEIGADSIARRVVVHIRIGQNQNLNGSGILTVTPKVGGAAASARPIPTFVESGAISNIRMSWQTKPIVLTSTEDTLVVLVHSDNANDVAVDIVAQVVNLDIVDTSGRVDVGSWLGTPVTLGGPSSAQKPDVNLNAWADSAASIAVSASGYPQVDVFSVGNATPISVADVADGVWDETATDHVSADTFGQQCKTDVDAILVDTTEIGAAGAGLSNINLPNQTMDIVGNITGNLSGSVASVTNGVDLNAAGNISVFTQADSALTAYPVPTASDVNAEVASVMDTAIPGGPTENSINERLAAVDDKLPSKPFLQGSDDADGGFDAEAGSTIGQQCILSLIGYGGPTEAEMNLRTLPTASYFDPTSDAVAQVTLVVTTTTNTDMVGTDNAALAADMAADHAAIKGATFTTGTDSLEAIRNRGDNAWVSTSSFIGETSAATVTSNTVFTINTFDGIISEDSFYVNNWVVLKDKGDTDRTAVRRIATYTQATRQITLDASVPFPGGLGVGDTIQILQSGYGGVSVTGGDATLNNQTLIKGAGYDSAVNSLVALTTAISGAAGSPSMG